ncbi:MAG: Sec-independent protein translocase subunit TatA/TatB [Planctomycetota bacterium]
MPLMRPPLAFFGGLGPMEMGIIALIALLLFGRRLPEVMRGLGLGVRQFRRGLDGSDDEDDKTARHEELPDAERKRIEGSVRDTDAEHQTTETDSRSGDRTDNER